MATFDAPHAQPQPLAPGWLSAHFAPLPYPARRAALARYGRALAPDADAALHTTLDSGDPEKRHTALFLAAARRDLDTVSRALADLLLRRRALSAAIRLPLGAQALTALALHDTSAVGHETYRVLKAGRRTALADTPDTPGAADRLLRADGRGLAPAPRTGCWSAQLPGTHSPRGRRRQAHRRVRGPQRLRAPTLRRTPPEHRHHGCRT